MFVGHKEKFTCKCKSFGSYERGENWEGKGWAGLLYTALGGGVGGGFDESDDREKDNNVWQLPCLQGRKKGWGPPPLPLSLSPFYVCDIIAWSMRACVRKCAGISLSGRGAESSFKGEGCGICSWIDKAASYLMCQRSTRLNNHRTVTRVKKKKSGVWGCGVSLLFLSFTLSFFIPWISLLAFLFLFIFMKSYNTKIISLPFTALMIPPMLTPWKRELYHFCYRSRLRNAVV